MDPALAVLILEAAIKYGPGVAKAIVELFKKGTFTDEEWNALFAIWKKPYEDYVAPREA